LERFVDSGKALAAKEFLVGKRRGMGRGYDAMPFGVDEFTFFLRVGAPQQENEGAFPLVESANDRISELLPPLIFV
jgi:hypothetical protein